MSTHAKFEVRTRKTDAVYSAPSEGDACSTQQYGQSKKGQNALRRTLTEGKLTQRRRHARDLHAAAPPPALIPARSD